MRSKSMTLWAAGLLLLTALIILWAVWLVASTRQLRQSVEYHVNFITSLHGMQDTLRSLDRVEGDRSRAAVSLRAEFAARMQTAREHAAGDAELTELLDQAEAQAGRAFAEAAPQRRELRAALDRLAASVDRARERMAVLANRLAAQWRQLVALAIVCCSLAMLLALLTNSYRFELMRRKEAEAALAAKNSELNAAVLKLQAAIDEIKTLRGLIPICATCKKIRDDQGYWQVLESYVSTHTEARFSHGICPACYQQQIEEVYKLYPSINPANELVDVIDEAGNTTGVVTRREMRAQRLPHRCTYVLVFNARGELFIHQRTAAKDVFPSYWDVCVGGVLAAGESFAVGAKREIREELGVDATAVELFPFRYQDDATFAHGMAYRLDHDGPFNLQVEEIVRGEFVPIAAVLERIRREPFCPDGLQVLERYLQRNT